MSDSYSLDMNRMHVKFGVHEKIENMDAETLRKFLLFRRSCMQEELCELDEAIQKHDSDGVVDSIIDLIVFAVGTLDLYNVDVNRAWDEVYNANMNKEIGIKESRPNPYGLPDLVKPSGWKAPNHDGNFGLIPQIFNEKD